MHVFQGGAVARRRILRIAATLATIVLVGGIAIVVAGIVSGDTAPVVPAFVGPLSPQGSAASSSAPFRLPLPPLPFFSSAPSAGPATPTPTTAAPASNAATPSARNTGNGPPSTPRGRTPSPRP